MCLHNEQKNIPKVVSNPKKKKKKGKPESPKIVLMYAYQVGVCGFFIFILCDSIIL